ncbi:MAG: BlaI/MecI/CopY family transcriptional regulator [Defluviitaleaceae bacterium]|nr:BlaI/MecI/CopY family transcriptional regulator [Defluviitaleaceae bacterium]
MAIKLFDAELKLMNVLWDEGEATAKRLAEILAKRVGWSKTTTYTIIKRCIEKGALGRSEPNFVCRPIVSIEDVREYETNELIKKMYDGAADQLVASILGRGSLSMDEIGRLKDLINEMEGRL